MNENVNNYGKEIFRAGTWVLTDECIYRDDDERFFSPIIRERFWETFIDSKLDKYNWPLHLVDKTWNSKEDIYCFNTVFFYALDFFKELKPETNKASIWNTLELQQRFLEDKK